MYNSLIHLASLLQTMWPLHQSCHVRLKLKKAMKDRAAYAPTKPEPKKDLKRGLKVILTVSRWHKDGLPGYSDVVVVSPSLSEVSRMAVAGPPTGCEELVNGKDTLESRIAAQFWLLNCIMKGPILH